jgi:hypothetical protein
MVWVMYPRVPCELLGGGSGRAQGTAGEGRPPETLNAAVRLLWGSPAQEVRPPEPDPLSQGRRLAPDEVRS